MMSFRNLPDDLKGKRRVNTARNWGKGGGGHLKKPFGPQNPERSVVVTYHSTRRALYIHTHIILYFLIRFTLITQSRSTPQRTNRIMSAPERIAIVGMSCRLPGGVTCPEDLWTMISRSRDGWGPIPENRFSTEAYYHPNPQKKGCFNVKSGYFIDEDLSQFDAPFFNITEQEANAMGRINFDHQSFAAWRLQLTWHRSAATAIVGMHIRGARERWNPEREHLRRERRRLRGIDRLELQAGHAAGPESSAPVRLHWQPSVYTGRSNLPLLQLSRAMSLDRHRLFIRPVRVACGCAKPAFWRGQVSNSGRLQLAPATRRYDFHVNDRVKFSLIFHCTLSAFLTFFFFCFFSPRLFNPHGKTFSFDHRAKSGYARGEGVGCLVLKPLEQALKDNDKIRCIITNTGTNQDGKTVGMFVYGRWS